MNPALEKDATYLRDCLKGKIKTENALVDFIMSKSRRDRILIRTAYKSCFGVELSKDIEKELGGNFRETVLGLFETPSEYDAKCLYKAMKGLGTDEDTLIEIICTRPNYILALIKEDFKKLYKKDLEEWVSSETSGGFKKILISLLQCNRSENSQPNDEDMKNFANKLFAEGEGKWGTNETLFNKVFAISSPPELYRINEWYIQLSGHDLKTAVEKEFSGDLKKALATILDGIICPAEYFALRINKAVKGFGTNDKMLVRVLVSREEIDIPQMREKYKLKIGKDMVEDIKDDTSGDYQKIVCAIASKNY